MTDRELLTMAAKAAGINTQRCLQYEDGAFDWPEKVGRWNPLVDDGDALRLANKLWLEVRHVHKQAHAGMQGKFWCTERWHPDGDQDAATRRAIVRAAAEVGRSMR